MKQIRLSQEKRQAQVLTTAIPLAIRKGYQAVTLDEVAKASGVTKPTLLYHFKSAQALREKLVTHALEIRCLPVIAQAIVAHDVLVADIPASLKARALKFAADKLPAGAE